MSEIILAIVGCRNATNYSLIKNQIDQYIALLGRKPDRIISGGASGVDGMARKYASEEGISFYEYPANWALHGRAAGPIRNRQIVENCTHVLAFPSSNSVGTRNTITIANELGKILTVVEI